MSSDLVYVLGMLCALGVVVSMTASAAEQEPGERPVIVVDNGDEGFSTSGGGWNPSTRDPGYYGSDYLWHARGKGEAKALWGAVLPLPGRYNVYARWVMSKPDDRATNAPFTVRSSQGDVTVRVNMAEIQSAAQYPAGRPQSPWNLLGTFPFDREAQVVLANDANNSVVADAVRFEYMEPLDAPQPRRGKLLFEEPCETMDNWFVEGEGKAEIVNGALRVVSTSNELGCHAWFRPDLPDNVIIDYDMTIHGPKGFALVFFCAHGAQGEDIITGLPARKGSFGEYVANQRLLCYHLSVHRMGPQQKYVEGANLNRNPPKTLIQRNAVDPCPPAKGNQSYHIRLIKMGRCIRFFVNDRLILFCFDENAKPYEGGKFGFRQIYLSTISYDNLRVYQAVLPEE